MSRKLFFALLIVLFLVGCRTNPIRESATADPSKSYVLLHSYTFQGAGAGQLTVLLKNIETNETSEMWLSTHYPDILIDVKPGDYVVEGFFYKATIGEWQPFDNQPDFTKTTIKLLPNKVYYIGDYQASNSSKKESSALPPSKHQASSSHIEAGPLNISGGIPTTFIGIKNTSYKIYNVIVQNEIAKKEFRKKFAGFGKLDFESPFTGLGKGPDKNILAAAPELPSLNEHHEVAKVLFGILSDFRTLLNRVDAGIYLYKDEEDVYKLYVLKSAAYLGLGNFNKATESLVTASKMAGSLQNISNELTKKMKQEYAGRLVEINNAAKRKFKN